MIRTAVESSRTYLELGQKREASPYSLLCTFFFVFCRGPGASGRSAVVAADPKAWLDSINTLTPIGTHANLMRYPAVPLPPRGDAHTP